MPKLQALQSLRALAASLVVVNHALGVAAGHGIPKDPYSDFANLLGAQGVAIFFLISGFIMTYTADTAEDTVPAGRRALQFGMRRIARVVPLYWFFTLLVAAVAALAGFSRILDTTMFHLVESMFFVPYVNAQAVMLPVLPLGWTLNYEMFFYVLFSLFLLMNHRYRIFGLSASLLALVGTGFFVYPMMVGGIPHSVGAFLTHPILLLFGAGALLGKLKIERPKWTLPVPGLLLFVPLLAVNCGLAARVYKPEIPMRWQMALWLVDLMLVGGCAFGRELRMPRLERLGDASYSLYLVHIFPLFVCFLVWKQLHYVAPIAFIVACLGLSFITAHGSYRYLERPLTRLALGLLSPAEKPVVVATPAAAPNLQQV